MKIILFLTVLSIINPSFAKILEIYDTKTQAKIEYSHFIQSFPTEGHIILGEFHNTLEIQSAQAEIIRDSINNNTLSSTINWEFGDYTNKTNILKSWEQYKKGNISVQKMLKDFTGSDKNHSYSAILEIAKKQNVPLQPINLPRKIKQQIIKNGISSVDQKYIPARHFVGNDDYEERFALAMGGHAPQDILAKYFEVQCLTDSVMAEQIYFNEISGLNFSIMGAFHSDFNDATVLRLKEYTDKPITTIKIVSINMSTANEIENYKLGSDKYGQYADYIVITK